MSKSPNEEIYSKSQEILSTINTYLNQNPIRKTLENDVMGELKKLKKQKSSNNSLITKNKDKISQQFKKNIQIKQKKIKQQIQKLKPMVPLTNEERTYYRGEITNIIKKIEKKINTLYQKKDNKKRQNSIQFFKYHQTKLAQFSDWLVAPSRQFSQEHMKTLMKYLVDLEISHQDNVFQEDIQKIYEKIIFIAEQPQQITLEMFTSSYINRPKINDYLPSKQTKETIARNSICPHYKMIDLSIMPKMNKETLFLMFYYHKGQTEQYLAAKQLMKGTGSWRFYSKFSIWLKRISQPTFDGPDHQTGSYNCVGPDLVKRQRKGIKVYHRYLQQQL